jgi:general transcription factor 3C polypeptide 3 (transcription factor C subunit 4)
VPYDPLICLAIAQAFFGRCTNRQSDNRNYQIVQVRSLLGVTQNKRADREGLAFLTKYRKYSPKDQRSQEEVEYNYGRSFHGLGT